MNNPACTEPFVCGCANKNYSSLVELTEAVFFHFTVTSGLSFFECLHYSLGKYHIACIA